MVSTKYAANSWYDILTWWADLTNRIISDFFHYLDNYSGLPNNFTIYQASQKVSVSHLWYLILTYVLIEKPHFFTFGSHKKSFEHFYHIRITWCWTPENNCYFRPKHAHISARSVSHLCVQNSCKSLELTSCVKNDVSELNHFIFSITKRLWLLIKIYDAINIWLVFFFFFLHNFAVFTKLKANLMMWCALIESYNIFMMLNIRWFDLVLI